ncbi:MAG: hypothetical protein HRU70_01535 [Phycisphaeraceae bacterium]|nr:MAG: hypothetical protein HRU70_01535 [Phycisphaeraceae bacterium]
MGAMLIAAGAAGPLRADVWSWNAGNGMWMTAGNWLPNSVPGIDPFVFNDIRIGDLPGVGNSTVLMNNAAGGGALAFHLLSLSSGMTLDMNQRQLGSLTGATSLMGANTRLIVRSSTGLNFHDFSTNLMTMGLGTHLQLVDDGRVRASTLHSRGLISGTGTIHVQGGGPQISLQNSGTIAGSSNGGLTFIQEGAGRFDLDGLGVEEPEFGQLSLASPFSVLTFQGDQLSDFFSGTVTMGSGSLLNMNMTNGWTADAMSTFNVSSGIAGAAAQIAGGHFTFGGDLNIGGTHGHLRVLADATLLTHADVFLGNDDRLEFDGVTAVQGGTFNLSQGGRIDFDGATQIGGGTFTMAGDSPAQGVVNFNGVTQWSGTTTFNGVARQMGNASVGSPTTINATVFDMDGNNSTAWTINHGLTVNAQAIEIGSQSFDGTLNLNAGAVGRLTVVLADPDDAWTMNGTLNLAGLGGLTTTRLAGSRVIVSGDVNMGAGIAQITADADLRGATVGIAANGNLRMRAQSTVDADTVFLGTGVLQNGVGAAMTLNSGVSLGLVGLVNEGLLNIGEAGPGVASVDRFSNTGSAALSIGIAGRIAGAEHDLLIVSGGAALLDGLLRIELLPVGGGATFTPTIGDEFVIISALGGVGGAFTNDPVTLVDGLTYEWTVIYNPNTVVVRLDGIVPTPGGLALLALGGLISARRRRA